MSAIADLPALVALTWTSSSKCVTLPPAVSVDARRTPFPWDVAHLELHQPPPPTTSSSSSAAFENADRLFTALHAKHQQHLQWKDATTRRYLQSAEDSVDKFLSSYYGFAHDAIPHCYLDTAPEDLGIVEDNLDTLTHCASDVFLPSSLIQTKLIRPWVARVQEQELIPLRQMCVQMVDRCEQFLLLGQSLSLSSSSGDVAPQIQSASKWKHNALQDLRYLDDMNELETYGLPLSSLSQAQAPPLAPGWSSSCGEGEGGPLSTTTMTTAPSSSVAKAAAGLSDVVPLSGLLLGRLHRLENEHRTVLEHWKPKPNVQQHRPPPPPHPAHF